jgi:hypothetical protein
LSSAIEVQALLGYMPQRFGLFEHLTVQENQDLYADLQGVPRPARRTISSWVRCKTVKTPLPTVPMPSKPTRMGSRLLLLMMLVTRGNSKK